MLKLRKTMKWAAGISLAALCLYMVLFLRGGEVHVLQSSILNEARTLSVYLPAGYRPEQAYPVTYTLDGEKWRHSAIMAASTRFAAVIGVAEPSIVIAVHTEGHRRRDYVPSAGAEAFLSFLQREVMPWVEDKYKTKGQRTLSGHSLGGLFSLYAMTQAPGMFQTYYAYDPSILRDKSLVQGLGNFTQKSGKALVLYMNYGFHSQVYADRMEEIEAVLDAPENRVVHWRSRFYPLPHSLIMLPGQLDAQLSTVSVP